MSDNFLNNTRLICCAESECSVQNYPTIDAVRWVHNTDTKLDKTPRSMTWLATRGLDYPDSFRQVIRQNQLDNFLNTLLNRKKHANKVVEPDNVLFIAVKNVRVSQQKLLEEQVFLVVSEDFVWSIQEAESPSIKPLINKLNNHQKQYQKTQIPQLLFFLISAISDSYEVAYQQLAEHDLLSRPSETLNADHIHLIEDKKSDLFALKSAVTGLRNMIMNLLKTKHVTVKDKYFSELQEQANHLITDIDFDLQELDSKLNLLISLQSNRLNETMQVLTVISIIFLPLNLIAGIYGMNFVNMPELKWHDGYFIVLGLMLTIAIAITIYLKRKHWF